MRSNFRSRAFLDLAHDLHECQLKIPGVCIGYSVDGCEPAHGNWSWIGKGLGLKSDDIFCATCHPCHVELDQGRKLDAAERELYWAKGAIKTMALLLKTGKLKIS